MEEHERGAWSNLDVLRSRREVARLEEKDEDMRKAERPTKMM